MQFFSYVAILLAISTASLATAAPEETTTNHRELQQVSSVASDLLNAVNDARASKGAKPLCLNTKLAKASQIQAEDMAKGGFISTTGSSGSTPTSRAEEQKFNTWGVAELVGAGYRNASHVVSVFMKDYSEYILADNEFLGAGYALNASQLYKTFWVLDFSQGGLGETCV